MEHFVVETTARYAPSFFANLQSQHGHISLIHTDHNSHLPAKSHYSHTYSAFAGAMSEKPESACATNRKECTGHAAQGRMDVADV